MSSPGAANRVDVDGEDCGFASGGPFMTQDEPDLEAAFTCAARMGDSGSPTEMPVHAALAALTDDPEALDCNGESFVRDDAVLVVTIITDEDDGTEGLPADWRDTFVEVKNGNDLAVVTLGLLGDSDYPDGLCTWDGVNGADDAPILREFVEAFGLQGLWASVCEPDYAPFFEEAVVLIDQACANFPAG